MSNYNQARLQVLRNAAKEAVRELRDAVIAELTPGTLVDYLVGGRWVGPCEVTHVSPWTSDEYGPVVRVKNLKSGKYRNVCSFNYVRPHEAAGGES